MIKQQPLLALFQKFITCSRSGKRLNKNGTRIKPQTVVNYSSCYKLLEDFSVEKEFDLVVYEVKGNNKREHASLKRYWNGFYQRFTDYLYKEKGCFDNYTGQTIKLIRTFFNWLNNDAGIFTGPYHRAFYVCKEEINIVTLTVDQLRFLAFDQPFENSLSKPLQRSKDIFVTGCLVGLRFSDLSKLKRTNIENRDGVSYLKVRSQKTNTDTLVKLPEPAIAILNKYPKNKIALLPSVSLFRFNKNVKKLAELAGWVHPIPRSRTKKGIQKEKNNAALAQVRFCDALSSHTMRRTSITTMLTSGMPEYIVRKISGHTSDSKAFFRYVSLAQSLMDKEIDKMHLHFQQPANAFSG